MRLDRRGQVIGWLALVAAVATAGGRDTVAGPAGTTPQGTAAVIGNDSYARTYLVYKTPVLITPDGQVKALPDPTAKQASDIADFQSPPPPAEWTTPEFDDAAWDRQRAPVEPDQPAGYTWGNLVAWHAATANALMCLRWKFVVDDPARVTDLRLSLEYVGGVVVYVNGRELSRANLPAGDLKPDTLAERYPDDLYVNPDGTYLQDLRKAPAGFERRYRKLADADVPANLLRKGVNVLAVAVHRSPVNEGALKAKRAPVGGMYVVPGLWAYTELHTVRLTAAVGSAVTPNTARPTGVQVWTCAPYDTVNVFDYGDPSGPSPIALSAARNGVFSGRLMVSSDQPIRGLKAAATDLKQADGGGAIPASAVRVRCADPAVPAKTRTPPYRFDGLLDAPPPEIPVVRTAPPREFYLHNGAYEGQQIKRTDLTAGALAPIWLSVRVPRDARPGRYEGTVTVSADGLQATTVPIRLTVFDWTVPSPVDFRVHSLGFNSPESVARHYGLPLWSDRHFEFVGKSLALMTEVGSREVLVDLAIDWYGLGGNRESVIRWIRQADGTYAHDFSVFDKYLDVVARSVGKPLPLRLNCWGEVRPGWGGASKDPTEIWKTSEAGTKVTLLNPATGQVEPLLQPVPATPESLAFWKPVLDEARKKIEAKGWFDVTSLGHNTYNAPPYPPIVSMARQIWPDGVWSYTAHNGTLRMNFAAAEKGVSMPARYTECVWTRGNLALRGYRALLEPRPAIWCWSYRGVLRDWSELALVRDAPEGAIMRGHDGVGQLGADIFPILGPNNRPFYLNTDRGGLGPTCSTMALLFPGPDGPVATERFEMFREGVQLSEAILFIERALQDKKVSGDLEQRANRCLDERSMGSMWRWPSGRPERDAALLALAAEVAAATK